MTAMQTYYRLECRTPAGAWVAYDASTTYQGWTPFLNYVEAHLEEALDDYPEDAGQYRIVTQLRGPITVYTDQEDDTTTGPDHLAMGSEWDDVDALTLACKESERDQITVIDCDGDVSVWGADARWWELGLPDYGCEPYTIIHAGKKADQ